MNKQLNIKSHINILLGITISIALSACANQPKKLQVNSSYLTKESITTKVNGAELLINETDENKKNDVTTLEEQQKFRFVPPMKLVNIKNQSAEDVLNQFSEQKKLTVSTDELKLTDYLHQVLGEQLNVSYVLSDDVKNDKQAVTLNLQEQVSERKLFTLTEELLTQRDYLIRFDDNIFYIHKNNAKGNKGDVIHGYGNTVEDIPSTSLDIIQMIPFKYGVQASVSNSLKLLLGIKSFLDQKRNSITVKGKRKDIIKAVEFIQIMDSPVLKDREIGIYQTSYLSTKELIEKLSVLLKQEGVSVAEGATTNSALSIVELDKQGKLIFFANELSVIERAIHWIKEIDKPIQSTEKQYFFYQPQYSRATDMGESLKELIGNVAGTNISNNTSAQSQNQSGARSKVSSASSSDLKMVVDERANALIFFSSGERYQQLLPLIKRLDVLPKQVVLEVMIAEVVLTDDFNAGVEFNLTNQGASQVGGFNLASGAAGLSYVLSGTQGEISIELFQSNTNVNVLSRPSLLVRDGVTASINVGDSIPTVGETVFDSTGQSRTTVVYLDTGVSLSVTPTINARGIIIMDIDQQTTGQADGGASVNGSPTISERNISTEVIAESGQTIVLGGLIKDTTSITDSGVPFFSSIPLIGKLFDSQSETTIKTELIVMVTPRIVESTNEWEDIKVKFLESFTQVHIH